VAGIARQVRQQRAVGREEETDADVVGGSNQGEEGQKVKRRLSTKKFSKKDGETKELIEESNGIQIEEFKIVRSDVEAYPKKKKEPKNKRSKIIPNPVFSKSQPPPDNKSKERKN